MNRFIKLNLSFVLISLLALQACNGSGDAPAGAGHDSDNTSISPPTADNPRPQDLVVATVRGEPITMQELQQPLIEGYGLSDLLLIVKLDLAKHELAANKLIVTPQDVETEKQLTLEQIKRDAKRVSNLGSASTQPDDDQEIKPDEAQALLDQVLAQDHLSAPEFQLIMETNACLRKIAGPAVAAKVNEQAVRDLFNAEYGEKVLIRYIVCKDMAGINDALRDLQAGKSFEDVAKARSIDTVTAPNGGELFPFTRQDNQIPDVLRTEAFQLKIDEISGAINYTYRDVDYFAVIKPIAKFPPSYAKFEDYKDAVRKELVDQLMQAAMKAQRQELSDMALASMSVKDPVLAKQWQQRIDQQQGEIRDRAKIRQKMDLLHQPPATRPAGTTNFPISEPTISAPAAAAPATMPAAR